MSDKVLISSLIGLLLTLNRHKDSIRDKEYKEAQSTADYLVIEISVIVPMIEAKHGSASEKHIYENEHACDSATTAGQIR